MKKIVTCFCMLFVVIINCYGQKKDALWNEIEVLTTKMYQDTISFENLKADVQQYLKKAQKSQRKLLIGRAYYILGYKSPDFDTRISYLDSAVFYTKDLKKSSNFPMLAYIAKGSTLQERRDYQEALDNYLMAESKAKLHANDSYKFDIKYNIASLKRVLGNYKEAEILFKECIAYQESFEKMYVVGYLYTLLQLSSVYYESGQVVKCTAINKKGVSIALQHNLQDLFYFFVVNEGINLNIKGDYETAIDSIEKATPHLSKPSKVVSDFYLAKSYYAIGKKEKALTYFKSIDSVFTRTNDLWPPLRESYEYLIKDAKAKGNLKLQLRYTNQLLKVDSIIHTDYKSLSHTITNKYDNLELTANRDALIRSLKKQKAQAVEEKNWVIEISICITLVLLLGVVYYYQSKRKYKKYKKLYDAIIEKPNSSIEEEIKVQNTKTIKVPMDIDDTVVQEVLTQLNVFEKDHLYLENQISLSDVAKIVNTNSKYLSKIINSHKKKNFTTYVNDLRIDYLIDRIRHDPVYKKYTINAIALEGGFSNPQTFYRLFKQRTGLKPGYFIKKVRENQQKD
ncbi:MAG: helix-turn-helix domain-containing protein [Kordia sp.]|uniref:helix-turn-helix domain-containing protein n=1 Tax=Kordia sp. TaxID=1965332 RepID=UPI00385991C4